MWNSPHSRTKKGKRYKSTEISALTYSLDLILNFIDSATVSEVVDERILKKLEKEEFVFALYEVLDALLEDTAIPKGGHRGHHEAIVAELLGQTYNQICCELDDSDMGEAARVAAWKSIHKLCVRDDAGPRTIWQLDDLALDIDDPTIYRSEKITSDHWQDLLLGEGGLWGEFLWDDDWRHDQLLDLPPPAAKKATDMLGIDLEQVHGLAHTPTKAEFRMADHYIRHLIWKEEASS